MKGKLSFMWRATLALVLVLSLGVVLAAPVAAAVSEPEVTVVPTTPADTTAVYTITFTTNTALTTAAGDTITFEFLTDTDISNITAAKTTVEDTAATTAASSVSISGQRVSITPGANVAAGEVEVIFGTDTNYITNPSDGDYTLEVYTSQEPTAVTSETYIISKALTSVNQPTLTPATLGTAATYAIPFTTSVELRTGDAIVIEFPVDTDISAVVAGDVTGVTAPSTSVVGQVLTITLGGALSAGAQTVTIANHIINPTTLENPDPLTTDWKLTIYTSHGHRIPVLSDAYTLTDPGTVVSQVGWLTVDEYVPNATPSTEFKIQTQTQYGNAANVAATTTFTLTASSGAFYSDSGCGAGTVITTIDITNNESDSGIGNLYYKGATATVGTVTITADETAPQGWTMASTTILVNPKLELWGGGELKASYATFVLAIAAALPYDTIKVPASTYDVGTLAVNKPYLTIESISGRDTTTIRGTQVFYADADNLVLGGAAGKGFTFMEGGGGLLFLMSGADDIEISYNAIDTTVITSATPGYASRGISTNDESSNIAGLTVSHNIFTLTDEGDQGIRTTGATQVNWTITDNTFTGTYPTVVNQSAIQIDNLSISAAALDTIISGNEITGVAFGVAIGLGELVCHASASAALEISGNTFDGSDYGIYLINVTGTHQDVVITENTLTSNTKGLAIGADADWEPGDFTVRYNDFVGNTYAVFNASTTALTADNNYWGDVTGPYHAITNPDGLGDEVSDDVDYTPWLNASGGGATLTDTITLVAGWNLISLPLIPVDDSIDTVLAELITASTVNQARAYNASNGTWGIWASTGPYALNPTLTEMEDGRGFWVEMSAGDTLTATGFVLPPPPQTPPTYSVYEGWNLIGFKSLDTTTDASVYLGAAVTLTFEVMWDYDAAAVLYEVVLTTDDLVPGKGYWLAVNADGTIYP